MVYLLGIDVGTSGIKVILVNQRGKTIVTSSEKYPVHTYHPGWAEQDPEQWWKSTIKSIRKVLAGTGIDSSKIQGVGLSGQTHGTVAVDKNLLPLRDAIIWMDRRSIAQVEKLRDKLGEEINNITGLPISCGFMAPSLLWIQKHEPGLWNKIHKVLLPKDYIRLKLTGEVASDVTDAGGTLLLNTHKRQWAKSIIDTLDIPYNFFPPLYESSQITGYITKKAARVTSLKQGTPIVAGGADQVMMGIGCSIIKSGEIACSIGTGALLFTCIDRPLLKPDRILHTIPYALAQKWILMGAILSGGSSFEWFLKQIISEKATKNLNPALFFSKKISSISAAKKGLLFLPYLEGERTPHLDPQARGAFIGLTLRHSQSDLIRAIMEGVVFALRDTLEEFKRLEIRPFHVVSSGGGAKNKLWRQIQADIFNLPVFTTHVEDASAYGASLVAAVGVGIFTTIQDACTKWIKKINEIKPNPENIDTYEKAYKVYSNLYRQLREDFHILSGMEDRKN
ncbi:xylulokinase [Candidatus Aerophobetes bacterium]|nr:xylulokinase [Candidatus Aerophobetes bacterium]